MEDIYELWEERKKRRIHIVCFEEGIGTGKTFKASIILWLQWLEITLHEPPQKYFGIDPTSQIAFVCSSRTEAQARKICFSKVKARFLSSFNRDYFPPNPRYTNEIQISRNNTFIYAGNSSALSVQGFDYYGGMMDECIVDSYVWTRGFEREKISNLLGKKNIEIHNFDKEEGKFIIVPAIAEECVSLGVRPVWELIFEDGDRISATEDTFFLHKKDFTNRYYKKMGDIREGDIICKVLRAFEKDESRIISEKVIEKRYAGKKAVYDFKNVIPNNNFLVGKYGIVVHNCNSMERTRDSKKAIGGEEIYDEGEELKDSIFSRMTSRFREKAGMLVCCSSARFDDDFLRKRKKEFDAYGDDSFIFYKQKMLSEAFYMSSKEPFSKYNKNVEKVFPESEGYFYIDLDTGRQVTEEVAKVFFDFVDRLKKHKDLILSRWIISKKEFKEMKSFKTIWK